MIQYKQKALVWSNSVYRFKKSGDGKWWRWKVVGGGYRTLKTIIFETRTCFKSLVIFVQ